MFMDAKKVVKRDIRIRNMTYTALICAALCVISPLSLPVGAVPISLATFAVMLGVYVTGVKTSTAACLLYLAIGAAGLPVFSGFGGGIGKLTGATGGYLIGYVFLAAVSGIIIKLAKGNRLVEFAGFVIGNLVLYAFGTAWLAYTAKLSFGSALLVGVIPFIPGDLLKTGLAMFTGGIIKNRIKESRIVLPE